MTITDNPAAAEVRHWAQDQEGKDYLGRVAWASQTKALIPIEDVKEILDNVGLGGHAPKAPSPPDVFRRVTRAAQQTIEHDDGTKSKIMARDVATNPNEVVRRMVVEKIDSAGQRLSYDQTWDLRYDKENQRLALYPINVDGEGNVRTRDRHIDPHETDDLISGIRAEYERNIGSADADALRSIITSVFHDNLAVTLRTTGGVVFIPRSYCGALEGLERAAAQIEGMDVQSIPLPAEPGKPEMLAEAIVAATVGDAERLIKEMKAAQAGESIGKRRQGTIAKEYRHIKKQLGAYKDLLQTDLAGADLQLTVLGGLMAQVLTVPVTDT